MILTKNDGPNITETNYWDGELARNGIIYVSINARTFRVLLPATSEQHLPDMRTAQCVIVTQGRLELDGHSKDGGLELLFEDGSDSPFAIHLGPEQTDRRLPASESGRTDLRCIVYSDGLKPELSLPARFRTATRLPYMQPWT